MSRLAWLTPNADMVNSGCIRIIVPDDPTMMVAFWGAFLLLTRESNWEQHGTMTPKQTADRFQAYFNRSQAMSRTVCKMIGEIFMWSGDVAPDGCLLCHGQALLIDDYPELFNVVGHKFGFSGSLSFVLPDLRIKFALGATDSISQPQYALAQTGGEETHQLTETELANHSHGGIHTHVPALVDVTTPIYVVDAPHPLGMTTDTASRGGDTPHNNMPPFLCLHFCIVAW